jgi:2',3'-cyclic-nucleotide 2'-phosphodiesterase (5'-nucleotidase family)
MSFRKSFVLLAALLAPFTGLWMAAQAPVHVVIMHTNDLHGQLLPRDGVGGIAQIATLIRNAHPDLVLDAGDIFTGTFLSDEFKGAPTIEAMNKIGYTAGTLGNHEFDYGQDALRLRLREAKFPILSANVKTPVAEIKKYTVVNAKGLRFGIIGVTTEELNITTHPKNLKGVTVRDPVKAIRDLLPELRSKSDFIIVTAHLATEEEMRIAAAFPEIRLIIGGHTHNVLGPIQMGQTLIAKTGSIGRSVGRVDLDFDGKKLSRIEGKLIPVTDVAPDPDVAKIVASFEKRIKEKAAEVVGEATGDFTRSSSSESALSDLIADAFRQRGKTEIAIHNTGGIRAPIAKGPVTWGDVFEVLPFDNTLVTLSLTGQQLKRTLAGGLLAVSGLHVELDLERPKGQQLISATMPGGAPIDDAMIYSVTTNDFLVAGGDGYVELGKGRGLKDTGTLLRDVLVDYIRARGTISPTLDGRIVVH